MSQKVLERLSAQFGARILSQSSFRGDEEAVVAPADWREVATFLRDDPECAMDHFIDLTAVDFPERELDDVQPLPRFDVVVFVRSLARKHRIRLKTRVRDGEELDTLIDVWKGADWTEREAYDMFGVRFRGHPDLRRILMYEEFVGYPLRKDYPIEKTQPLVPYRDVEDIDKLPPFGPDEGQPWTRVDWSERLRGRDVQVSPAIGAQQGQRPALSTGVEHDPSAAAAPASVED
jgi:NADH-quinone oxidoreductase subunit C